jgi:hypothetical protein
MRIGELSSTARRSNSPAQSINQRLPNDDLSTQTGTYLFNSSKHQQAANGHGIALQPGLQAALGLPCRAAIKAPKNKTAPQDRFD